MVVVLSRIILKFLIKMALWDVARTGALEVCSLSNRDDARWRSQSPRNQRDVLSRFGNRSWDGLGLASTAGKQLLPLRVFIQSVSALLTLIPHAA